MGWEQNPKSLGALCNLKCYWETGEERVPSDSYLRSYFFYLKENQQIRFGHKAHAQDKATKSWDLNDLKIFFSPAFLFETIHYVLRYSAQ